MHKNTFGQTRVNLGFFIVSDISGKMYYKCDICEKVVLTTENTLKTHLKNLFFKVITRGNYKNFSY